MKGDETGIILAIETAGRRCGVALVDGRETLAALTLGRPGRHSRRLLSAVSLLLGETGAGPGDLAAVAVSAGPGSFTGLRIGMATARGLAMAAGAPVYAVPTLDALAARIPCPGMPVCAVSQARKNELYIAAYRCRPGALPERSTPVMVMKPEEVRGLVRERTLFTGTDDYRDYGLAAVLGEDFVPVDPRICGPDAAAVGMLAAEMMRRGEEPAGDEAEPIYVRRSQAEENMG